MISTDIRPAAARAEAYVYAALRVIAGLMLAFHGAQKILGWYGKGVPPALGSQLWFGGMIELVGGALVALGLLTRPAAFLLSGTMAVAYIQFHWKFALGNGMWLPTLNKGELAVLYSFVFLFIAARGAGAFSLQAVLQNARRSQSHAPGPHRRAGIHARPG